MRDEERLILELCKSHSKNTNILPLIRKNKLDWEYFLRVISIHEVAPLVLDRLLQYPLPDPVAPLITEQSKKEIVEVTISRKVYKDELNKLKKIFKDNGIEFILIKGLSLDFLKLRTTGDIDVLVKEDNWIRAIRLLQRHGYRYRGHTNWALKAKELKCILHAINSPEISDKERQSIQRRLSWNYEYGLYNEQKRILVEIHTNLFYRKRIYVENIEKLLGNIDIFWKERRYHQELDCYVLSNEQAMLLMCLHNAIKRSPGRNSFRLKQISDIHNLIERGISWEAFLETAVSFQVAPFTYFSLLVARKLLQTDIPEPVLSRLKNACTPAQLLLTDIHMKCLKSLRKSSIIFSKLYMILAPFIFGNRLSDRLKWMFLLPLILPSKRKMAARFHLDHNSPLIYFTYLLNPFRWVYVVAKHILRR